MGKDQKSIPGIMVFAVIALAACLAVWGLTKQRIRDVVEDRKVYKFGATYMTMNNPFYEIIDNEIRGIVEARGDMLITRDPALDISKQIEQVKEMIDRKVDGLFINPVDWKMISPALKEAYEAGIPIIVVDSDVFDWELVNCTVVSDNYEAGVQCAEHLLEHRKRGNIIVLTHSAAKSGFDRIQGFKDTIKGHEEFVILAEEDCLGQLEVAMPVTEWLLKEYPKTDVIMCLNDLAAMGTMAALKDAGLESNIAVYGVDGSPDGKSMVEAGFMEATAAQFPRRIGKEAAEALYQILNGEPVETTIRIETELIDEENLRVYGSDGWQ